MVHARRHICSSLFIALMILMGATPLSARPTHPTAHALADSLHSSAHASERPYHVWWVDHQGGEHSALLGGEEHLSSRLTFVDSSGGRLWMLDREPALSLALSCGCDPDALDDSTRRDARQRPLLKSGAMDDATSDLFDRSCHARRVQQEERRLYLLYSETSPEPRVVNLERLKWPKVYNGSLSRSLSWIGQLGHLVLFHQCEDAYACGAHGNIYCQALMLDLKHQRIQTHREATYSGEISAIETPAMKRRYEELVYTSDTPFSTPEWVGLNLTMNAEGQRLYNIWQGDTCYVCSAGDWSSYMHRFDTPLSSAAQARLPAQPQPTPEPIRAFIRDQHPRAMGWTLITPEHYPKLRRWFLMDREQDE